MYEYFTSLLVRRRKKKFLQSFHGLKIRKANSIRVSGSYAGNIQNHFVYKKPDHGFKDPRDYRSKLVNIGLSKVSFEKDGDVPYDIEKIYFCHEITGERNKTVKVNLAELDLEKLNNIAIVMGPHIDLYDLISVLMIIGQDHRNGSVRHTNNGKPKIYS